jgi:hypothetical protein
MRVTSQEGRNNLFVIGYPTQISSSSTSQLGSA